MANITGGTSVSASGFNGLFTRLDNIRKNHLNKDGQNATANSTFTTAFNSFNVIMIDHLSAYPATGGSDELKNRQQKQSQDQPVFFNGVLRLQFFL